jgi:hypothetical protein
VNTIIRLAGFRTYLSREFDSNLDKSRRLKILKQPSTPQAIERRSQAYERAARITIQVERGRYLKTLERLDLGIPFDIIASLPFKAEVSIDHIMRSLLDEPPIQLDERYAWACRLKSRHEMASSADERIASLKQALEVGKALKGNDKATLQVTNELLEEAVSMAREAANGISNTNGRSRYAYYSYPKTLSGRIDELRAAQKRLEKLPSIFLDNELPQRVKELGGNLQFSQILFESGNLLTELSSSELKIDEATLSWLAKTENVANLKKHLRRLYLQNFLTYEILQWERRLDQRKTSTVAADRRTIKPLDYKRISNNINRALLDLLETDFRRENLQNIIDASNNLQSSLLVNYGDRLLSQTELQSAVAQFETLIEIVNKALQHHHNNSQLRSIKNELLLYKAQHDDPFQLNSIKSKLSPNLARAIGLVNEAFNFSRANRLEKLSQAYYLVHEVIVAFKDDKGKLAELPPRLQNLYDAIANAICLEQGIPAYLLPRVKENALGISLEHFLNTSKPIDISGEKIEIGMQLPISSDAILVPIDGRGSSKLCKIGMADFVIEANMRMTARYLQICEKHGIKPYFVNGGDGLFIIAPKSIMSDLEQAFLYEENLIRRDSRAKLALKQANDINEYSIRLRKVPADIVQAYGDIGIFKYVQSNGTPFQFAICGSGAELADKLSKHTVKGSNPFEITGNIPGSLESLQLPELPKVISKTIQPSYKRLIFTLDAKLLGHDAETFETFRELNAEIDQLVDRDRASNFNLIQEINSDSNSVDRYIDAGDSVKRVGNSYTRLICLSIKVGNELERILERYTDRLLFGLVSSESLSVRTIKLNEGSEIEARNGGYPVLTYVDGLDEETSTYGYTRASVIRKKSEEKLAGCKELKAQAAAMN